MTDRIVQLKDRSSNNIFPIAGGTTQGAVTKSMLDEGIFEGQVLSQPSNVAYVATDNIQDGAVTAAKLGNGVGIHNILSGTSAPGSSQGQNGDLYVQYNA